MRVQPERLANRVKDAMLPQVFATPRMILVMENMALNAIGPFLDAGESGVGTAVDLNHFAATPVGHDVRATAEVIGVAGKRASTSMCRQATARRRSAAVLTSES